MVKAIRRLFQVLSIKKLTSACRSGFAFLLFLISLSGQTMAQTALNQMLTSTPVPVAMPATSGLLSTFTPVTGPSTFVNYAYVFQAANANSTAGMLWTINDTLPTGFAVSACKVAIGNAPFVLCSTLPSTQYSVSGLTNTWVLTGITAGYVTVALEGQFNYSALFGQSSFTVPHYANATVGANPNPNPTAPEISSQLGVNLSSVPPTYNVRVEKTASPSSFTGSSGVITYTIKVMNTGTAPVPIAYTATLYDKLLNNSNTSSVTVSSTTPSCSGSGCVTFPALPSSTIPAGGSVDILGSGVSFGGMPAGSTATITYTVNASSTGTCASITESISNYAYISLGSSTGSVIDGIANDNDSRNTLGYATTAFNSSNPCPPPVVIPAPSVTKKIVSAVQGPIGSGLVTVKYHIEVVNNSTTLPITMSYTDYVYGAATSPASAAPLPASFDVTPTVGSVGVNLGSNPILSSLSNVGSLPAWGGVPSSYYLVPTSPPLITVPASGNYKLDYEVTYKAHCPQRSGRVYVYNRIWVAINTAGSPIGVDAAPVQIMNLPPVCKLAVSKSLVRDSSNAGSPLNFGFNMGTYTVKWVNPSPMASVVAGVVRDTLSLSSASYATTPVSYSSLNCNGAGVTFTPPASTGSAVVNYQSSLANGTSVINIQNVTFAPNSTLTCTYVLKVNQPSIGQFNCQSNGAPNIVNYAMADPDPAFNSNGLPAFDAPAVVTLLPLCRNISLLKTVAPTTVLPGSPVVWTILATNNAPTTNASFTISDIVNPLLAPVSGNTCVITAGTGTIGTCSAVTTTVNNLTSQGVMKEVFTTSTPTTIGSVQNVANVSPMTGTYFQNGTPLQGDASITTNWPSLTKKFTPQNIISGAMVQLTFTVTNLGYKPAVSDLAFTDTLSPGLLIGIGGVSANTCGGTAPVAIAGTSAVSWSGGALAAGQASCSFTITVMQTDYTVCPVTYLNKNATHISNVNHLDTSNVDASLQIKCNTEVAMLKICKIAGPGVAVGTVFTFNAGGRIVSVPAGPAPGGTCVAVPSFATGSNITVTEVKPPYFAVSEIVTVPSVNQSGVNLSVGSVNLTLNPGVTEVNFTNERLKGYIEICKKVEPMIAGNYTFMINGNIRPFTVATGTCTHAIQVPAGPVVVTETSVGANIFACNTYPAGFCNLSSVPNTVNVNVIPGGISSQTVLTVINRPLPPCDKCQ